ncbi:hypothetical protein R3Q06_32780 [Rhodococcus erythropolis]|uniref:LGFP repeat-containing protein n=1 Tax=Rhodococcus erythropolis TaxID=1833 RepID=UPI00294A81F3|nr:hypothetical protein [Rhodococcus erythropolis]MDV6278242.1 hypothetical protein [Rhodococcus erythropolis]
MRGPQDCVPIVGFRVCGDILAKYESMGGIRSKLGVPTSNEKTLPDGQGRANSFEHGSIYWSPPSGAHPIWGRIGDKWADKKWESGFLGYPTTDEDLNPDNRGFRQVFQGGLDLLFPADRCAFHRRLHPREVGKDGLGGWSVGVSVLR